MKNMKLSCIVRTILLKSLSSILLLRKKIIWFLQYKRLPKGYIKANEFKFAYDDKILIIVPHADDELIGTYEIIKKYKYNVELFYCAYTGSNSSKENCNTRLYEFKQFCEQFNIRYTVASTDIQTSLNEKIIQYSPNYIFIPSFIDWHEEHIKVNELMLNSVEALYNIVLYQISVPIYSEIINYYIPMHKKEHKSKWKDFYNIYVSQRSIPFTRFMYNEMINRIDGETYASEVFTLLKYSDWKKLFLNFQQQKENIDLNTLKSSINDLIEVRNQAKQIYKLIELRDE